MRFTLEVWTQASRDEEGHFERYDVDGIDPDASFLEMLDELNARLAAEGKRTIAFDSDCREGICGMCSLTIDGQPHGPNQVTTCQTFMRDFEDGATIRVERMLQQCAISLPPPAVAERHVQTSRAARGSLKCPAQYE